MASKAKVPYTYSPLLAHPNSIRLLRLLPASRAEDPVRCRIFNYSLTTPARTSHLYECLSYVWGDVKERQTIQVDDAELAVTKNLYGALRRLRDPDLDRVVWVDALCINQDDIEERAKQVQIMARIYACASRVVVWLGEEADGSKEAMELLREDASRVYRKQRKLHDTEDELYEEEIGDDAPGDLPLGDETLKLPKNRADSAARSFQSEAMELLRRPWFQRIWVLQEMAAARVMVVLCGSDELTGAGFFWGLSGLLEWCRDVELRGMVSSILYLLGDASVMRVDKPDDAQPFRLGICPLSQLVDMFRLREATDPRDKVYALLGIMSQESTKTDIVPDYGIEWDDLFRNLVHSVLGLKAEAAWVAGEKTKHGQISAKGCTIGYISNVDVPRSDHQVVSITSTYHCDPIALQDPDIETWSWALHSSAAAVRQGDIVCWLEGSTGATIIRFESNCFTIIVIWASLPSALSKILFCQQRDLGHESADEVPAPRQYNRSFDLVWSFDTEWTTQSIGSSPNIKKGLENLNAIFCMAQVLEDVNATELLESLFERGSHCLRSDERPETVVVHHFRDLSQALPNWHLYLQLKHDLQYVLCGPGLTSGSPKSIGLDLVNFRSCLDTNPECGTDLIKLWSDEFFNSRGAFHERGQSLKLAFLLDVWGNAIALDAMLGLVELVERISLNHRATLGSFPIPIYMEVVEILVQSTTQHRDWGDSLAERLVKFAKGNVDRVYCLVRAYIVCNAASSEWKQTVVEAVMATHFEELSRANTNTSCMWTSLEVQERYTAAVEFLWGHYILHAKDFVRISTSGTFQLRSQLMQKFVSDHRFWNACYDGNAADVRGLLESGQVDPLMGLIRKVKDTRGRWVCISAWEAAAINGHVECCKLLLNHGYGDAIRVEMGLYRFNSIPLEIVKLLAHNSEDSRTLPAAQGQGSSGVISRDVRRSETW